MGSTDFKKGSRKSFGDMDTASLYALLEANLETKNSDLEEIEAILAVLSERTEEIHVDVDAAWNSFLHNYSTGEELYPVPKDLLTELSKEEPNQ